MSKRQEARARAIKARHRKTGIRAALWALGLGIVVLGGYAIQGADRRAPHVTGEGRSDASHVMHPSSFLSPRAVAAYAIAQQIPATLNHLYCWCACDRYHGHRSALACFEDTHGSECDVCMRTAEIAWDMVKRGVTNAAAIQREIDRWVRSPG